MSSRYNHKKTEAYWQTVWEREKVFKAKKNSKKKYYVLEMFPYPSGKIHMGHVRNYTLGDVLARYKKMNGFNVMHPMGWDAFGLPAENAALVEKKPPSEWTYNNIKVMRSQLKTMGLSIDWDREIATCHPGYYQHEQAFFVDLVKHDLAYKKESFVNWDPVDQTVLANEQVIDGKGWRSGAIVEQKKLSQWFLRTSKYSEELLSYLKKLPEWPNKVKTMQSNWIGKSEGTEINFKIKDHEKQKYKSLNVFTTRPDTIFGASFCAISIDHPLAKELSTNNIKIMEFINTNIKTDPEKNKVGIDTCLSIEHPFVKDKTLPLFIANFVLMDYGSGAIFGCPAHDQRDLDFALKYDLEILPVVNSENEKDLLGLFKKNIAFTGNGKIFNSDFLNNKTPKDAKEIINKKLQDLGIGGVKINYKLRDWGLSRQRYWGCPIPVLYREDGKIITVPKDQLPIKLPEITELSGSGKVLDSMDSWKNTFCPETGMKAVRETDTFDTFFESSWYFLRYCNPRDNKAFNKKDIEYWLPVDQYIGGIEHAILHLLYARFFVKALRDMNYINLDEPFTGLFTQGMVTHKTFKTQDNQWLMPNEVIFDNDTWVDNKDEPVQVGKIEKMSKSKKNVIDPNEIIKTYGADTARWFMLSDSPPDRDMEWTDVGIANSHKLICKIWDMAEFVCSGDYIEKNNNKNVDLELALNKVIKSITDNIESFSYNKCIANIYEFINSIQKLIVGRGIGTNVLKKSLKELALLIQPFVPHLSEEIWKRLGGEGLAIQKTWPSSSGEEEDLRIKIAIQINGKTKDILSSDKNKTKDEILMLVKHNKKINKFTDGKKIVKIIYVPHKVVNLVMK